MQINGIDDSDRDFGDDVDCGRIWTS